MANFCIFCGRLTKDPDIRYTQGDKPMCVARFSLAVSRNRKDGGADFPNMVAFGKIAEIIERYVTKGTKLVIRSHVQTGSYTNRDGQKVFTTDFVVDEIEFAESKNAARENQDPAPAQSAAPANRQPVYDPGPLPKTVDDFMAIPDTGMPELPFA